VEGLGQSVEREDDVDVERDYRDHSIVGRLGEPVGKGERQLQPAPGGQHLDFPQADGRQKQFAAPGLCVQCRTLLDR
jgi:hypothetical protein